MKLYSQKVKYKETLNTQTRDLLNEVNINTNENIVALTIYFTEINKEIMSDGVLGLSMFYEVEGKLKEDLYVKENGGFVKKI